MSANGGYTALSKTVNQIIAKARQKQDSNIKQGRVLSSSAVEIDGKSYNYTMAVDINPVNGQYVWCEMCGTRAVIVGA